MQRVLAATAARLGLTCLLWAMMLNGTAQADELTVLSGNGARAAVTELLAQFERASGHKVTVHFEVNPGVKRRVEAGEAFDVVVLNPPVLDELIRQGHVVATTRAVLGRAGIGAAVRAGTPLPDISTVEAFKRTLLGVNSVAYPGEGASGKYFVSVVERLGITNEMRPKMRPMPAEYNVEVVARGEVDLVVVVASRVAGVPGVTLVGPIPQALQTWIGFAAGVGSRSKVPGVARELVRFLTASAAAPVLRSFGVEPFVE
jgi:molybdate transport system substrate-binding protein